MKFSHLFTCLALASGLISSPSFAATKTLDAGPYTVAYDDSTIFGDISAWLGGGSNNMVTWDIPASVTAATTGPTDTETYTLPSFTITANSGNTLSGSIGVSAGNLSFAQFGTGSSTSANMLGSLAVDGISTGSMGGNLTATLGKTGTGFQTGYYSGTSSSTPSGPFTSFNFSGGTLTLAATGNAAIMSDPQNHLTFTFTSAATPVPEPETYALMLAGVGLIGLRIAKQQKSAKLVG